MKWVITIKAASTNWLECVDRLTDALGMLSRESAPQSCVAFGYQRASEVVFSKDHAIVLVEVNEHETVDLREVQ